MFGAIFGLVKVVIETPKQRQHHNADPSYTKAKPQKNTQLTVLQVDTRVDSMASAAMKDSGAVGTGSV